MTIKKNCSIFAAKNKTKQNKTRGTVISNAINKNNKIIIPSKEIVCSVGLDFPSKTVNGRRGPCITI